VELELDFFFEAVDVPADAADEVAFVDFEVLELDVELPPFAVTSGEILSMVDAGIPALDRSETEE
jgi:hypothetical protein